MPAGGPTRGHAVTVSPPDFRSGSPGSNPGAPANPRAARRTRRRFRSSRPRFDSGREDQGRMVKRRSHQTTDLESEVRVLVRPPSLRCAADARRFPRPLQAGSIPAAGSTARVSGRTLPGLLSRAFSVRVRGGPPFLAGGPLSARFRRASLTGRAPGPNPGKARERRESSSHSERSK